MKIQLILTWFILHFVFAAYSYSISGRMTVKVRVLSIKDRLSKKEWSSIRSCETFDMNDFSNLLSH